MAITISGALAKAWGVTGDPARDRIVKCEALRGFCLGDAIDVQPGDKFEIPERRARAFRATGRLRILGAADPVLASSDPVLGNSDPGELQGGAGELENRSGGLEVRGKKLKK